MNYFLIRRIDAVRSSVCGCAMLSPGWIHMTRRLENESVLILGRKNSTLLDDEGERLEVKPGRMVVLPANRLHKGLEPVTQPVSYYWVHFSQRIDSDDEKRYLLPKLVEEKEAKTVLGSRAVAYQRLEDAILLPQTLDVREPEPLYNQFAALLAEHEKPGCSPMTYRLMVQELLVRFYSECFTVYAPSAETGAKPSLVQEIVILIEENLSDVNTSVKYLAGKLHMNDDYLGRCFKEAMHISVGQYIVRKRVELTCMRLRENHDSIDIIAGQCGFGSRRQFYDQFQMITGKTPGAYRADAAFIGTITL
jgi:AraC-type DNA-binding domain-containing proteins